MVAQPQPYVCRIQDAVRNDDQRVELSFIQIHHRETEYLLFQVKMATSSWKDFNYVFEFNPDYSYGQNVVEATLQSRVKLEKQLFVDRLMKLLGVHNREISLSIAGRICTKMVLVSCQALSSEIESRTAPTLLTSHYLFYRPGPLQAVLDLLSTTELREGP